MRVSSIFITLPACLVNTSINQHEMKKFDYEGIFPQLLKSFTKAEWRSYFVNLKPDPMSHLRSEMDSAVVISDDASNALGEAIAAFSPVRGEDGENRAFSEKAKPYSLLLFLTGMQMLGGGVKYLKSDADVRDQIVEELLTLSANPGWLLTTQSEGSLTGIYDWMLDFPELSVTNKHQFISSIVIFSAVCFMYNKEQEQSIQRKFAVIGKAAKFGLLTESNAELFVSWFRNASLVKVANNWKAILLWLETGADRAQTPNLTSTQLS